MPVRIDRLDLKILKVLLTLEQTRNTYRAADRLHLSQSAVSRALGRLREALDDPVFVREPGGLKPTALTQRLVARLPAVLDMLGEAVDEGAGFNPATWSGDISIALGSHVMRCWGRDIYEALDSGAPSATWNFRAWHAGTARRILDGRIELGIHFANDTWEQSLYQQPIAEDPFVLLVRKGHPAAGQRIDLSFFERYELVSLLIPDWNQYGNVLEHRLMAQAVTPRVALRSESLGMALDCLLSGNSAMAGTRRLVSGRDDLVALEYPPELDVPTPPMVACYPRRMRESARYRWLVSTIVNAISGQT